MAQDSQSIREKGVEKEESVDEIIKRQNETLDEIREIVDQLRAILSAR